MLHISRRAWPQSMHRPASSSGGRTRFQTEPVATGEKNSAGAIRRAPAGAPIWNSPTIDAKRRRLYVGTGEGYTSPAAPQTDSVLAFDLDTGRMLWSYQSIAKDAWNMACFIGGGPNCSE
jgi:polyvinyl alcohol dehydrogenase (cytochrome)